MIFVRLASHLHEIFVARHKPPELVCHYGTCNSGISTQKIAEALFSNSLTRSPYDHVDDRRASWALTRKKPPESPSDPSFLTDFESDHLMCTLSLFRMDCVSAFSGVGLDDYDVKAQALTIHGAFDNQQFSNQSVTCFEEWAA